MPTSDDSAVYSSTYHSSTEEPTICKLILGNTNIDCFTATGMSETNMAFNLISDTELFVIWVKDDGSTNMIFQRLIWGSTSPVWSHEVTCPDGSSCVHGFAHVLMSADNTQVYTLTAFGQIRHAYFIVLDSSSGNVVQGDAPLILKSSGAQSKIDGLVRKNNYLFMLLDGIIERLLVFDLSTFSVKESLEVSSTLQSVAIAIEPNTLR